MRAVVLGTGESGRAAAAALESDGCEVEVVAGGCDLVVASPGMRVVSELQYGVERLKARGVRLLAVTGSKGKSSVVKLVADALASAGLRAVACGNYGLPVSAVDECDWAVVEVSSFQMETTNLQPGTFEAATVLNLQEDHLDRHGSAAVYHALKLRLLDAAKRPVLPRDAEDGAALLAGSYFDNEVLRPNGFAAIGLLRAAGLEDSAIAAAFASFRPLPHRMSLIGVFRGVRCIDDSKATSMAALAAGVVMAGSGVRLIAGGRAKGDKPESAIKVLTSRAKKVYLIGECADSLFRAWSRDVDCEVCGDMATAVGRAFAEADSGDTLLLSPGAASFDQFHSFGERGDVFAGLVAKEGQGEK